jgi:hypothetical protein
MPSGLRRVLWFMLDSLFALSFAAETVPIIPQPEQTGQ